MLEKKMKDYRTIDRFLNPQMVSREKSIMYIRKENQQREINITNNSIEEEKQSSNVSCKFESSRSRKKETGRSNFEKRLLGLRETSEEARLDNNLIELNTSRTNRLT